MCIMCSYSYMYIESYLHPNQIRSSRVQSKYLLFDDDGMSRVGE